MGLAVRVIPCLDVRDGRVVKGVKFVDIRDVGDPAEAAARYEREGADELCLLDITASHESRSATLATVTAVATELTIPLTVGGGVADHAAFDRLLHAGADKVSVNSAALDRPELISELAGHFGSQCVVVAVDARRAEGGGWNAYTHGGRKDTGVDVLDWCARAAELGAGELLLTSMDADGTRAGYDLELLSQVASRAGVPLIASGGAGSLDHFAAAIAAGADAVLAASVLHDRHFSVAMIKESLAAAKIEVRLS